MGLREVMGDVAVTQTAAAAGTYTSGPVANSGTAADVVLMVHCTAITGTSPTLNASLEGSSDGSSWSAITGSSITQITAAGSQMANARISTPFVRVTSTVGGTSPSVTYRAAVLVIPE